MSRAVTAQKCVRAGGKHNDLDNVGYTARHHTFFEMLGNFSFGDYFKDHAIELAWNLVTKEFGLAKDRLWVTVHPSDDSARRLWKKIADLPDDAHRRPPGQYLGDGTARSLRLLLGNLLRSRRVGGGRSARISGGGRRPFSRVLESRLHAIRAGRREDPHRAAAALDRHRHGSRAYYRHPPGRHQQLRDRPLSRADPRGRQFDRRRSERAAEGLAPRHRRSSAGLGVPDRRRRAALERGPRLCAAPHHAARHAPCRAARRQGAADLEAGAGAGARDGPGLSGIAARRCADHRDAAARGDPLPPHARARPRRFSTRRARRSRRAICSTA